MNRQKQQIHPEFKEVFRHTAHLDQECLANNAPEGFIRGVHEHEFAYFPQPESHMALVAIAVLPEGKNKESNIRVPIYLPVQSASSAPACDEYTPLRACPPRIQYLINNTIKAVMDETDKDIQLLEVNLDD